MHSSRLLELQIHFFLQTAMEKYDRLCALVFRERLLRRVEDRLDAIEDCRAECPVTAPVEFDQFACVYKTVAVRAWEALSDAVDPERWGRNPRAPWMVALRAELEADRAKWVEPLCAYIADYLTREQ